MKKAVNCVTLQTARKSQVFIIERKWNEFLKKRLMTKGICSHKNGVSRERSRADFYENNWQGMAGVGLSEKKNTGGWVVGFRNDGRVPTRPQI